MNIEMEGDNFSHPSSKKSENRSRHLGSVLSWQDSQIMNPIYTLHESKPAVENGSGKENSTQQPGRAASALNA